MDLYRWGMTAAENIESVPDGAPEGWRWTRVAETCKTVMAEAREWYENPEWIRLVSDPVSRSDEVTIRVLGADRTSAFPAGSRLRMVASDTIVDATIVGAVFAGGDTLVTITEAEVPPGTSVVMLHSLSNWASAAFRKVGTSAGRLVLQENVRILGEETVSSVQMFAPSTIQSGVNPIYAWNFLDSSFLIPGADGVQEMFLSLCFRFEVVGGLGGANFFLYRGPTGSFLSDPQIFRFSCSMFAGGGFAAQHDWIRSIPMIPIGIPQVGDRLSLWASKLPVSGAFDVRADPISRHHIRMLR